MFSECLTIKVPDIVGIIFALGLIGLLIFAGVRVYKGGSDDQDI